MSLNHLGMPQRNAIYRLNKRSVSCVSSKSMQNWNYITTLWLYSTKCQGAPSDPTLLKVIHHITLTSLTALQKK